ncbi:hypothetical protein KUTeg_007169 [Tegillarca granosa]|uniref:Uncharacterized protein n=1 Tax=Tegillarca granosa TaxID=220873 RepID=A0ABQ9FCH5_TEGGR|nr:hypothetical protein KUTeg_007169 [Tegillarca granosa]
MLNKTQLFVLDRCTNAKKILQFIQKSKIFHTQYDFMNLVPKSIGSDIKTSITVTDENRTAFLSLSDGDNLHHVQCREEFKINCSETAHTYKKQCLKDRTVQVNLSDTPDIDMGYIVQETKLLNSVSPESFELETGGFVQVRSGLNSESLDVSKNELKENLEGQILETIPDYSENSNTETDVHVQNRTHLNCDCFKVQQIETKPVVHKTTELQKDLFSSYDNDWRSISSVEEYFDLLRETQTNCDDGFYPKKEKHRYFNFTRDILLYPVHRLSLESSFYQLLIGENRLSPDLMRYEFHRLNSFINFSNEWSPSRIKLARNGWFSTGNGKETKCFSCGVYYNSWTCESDPLDIHKKISPYCSMVNGMDENNVPISKEIETANSQTNRYEAHKNGYQRPSRLLSEFEIVENTKKPMAKNLKQNSSDQRKTETENVSILSVDQLSLSSTFQNLGLACGTHNEGSEPETNPGTLSNICTNSNLTKCRAKQSVGGGKLYKYAISSDQKDAKYVNDTIENKVNGMNKSKQLPKPIGNDTIDKAYNGHHFQ